jgi:hypothetical protein
MWVEDKIYACHCLQSSKCFPKKLFLNANIDYIFVRSVKLSFIQSAIFLNYVLTFFLTCKFKLSFNDESN